MQLMPCWNTGPPGNRMRTPQWKKGDATGPLIRTGIIGAICLRSFRLRHLSQVSVFGEPIVGRTLTLREDVFIRMYIRMAAQTIHSVASVRQTQAFSSLRALTKDRYAVELALRALGPLAEAIHPIANTCLPFQTKMESIHDLTPLFPCRNPAGTHRPCKKECCRTSRPRHLPRHTPLGNGLPEPGTNGQPARTLPCTATPSIP